MLLRIARNHLPLPTYPVTDHGRIVRLSAWPSIARAAAALAMSATACSGAVRGSSPDSGAPEDGGTDGDPDVDACGPYVSKVDLDIPVVSFAEDVFPMLEESCTESTACHGDPAARSPGLFFLGCFQDSMPSLDGFLPDCPDSLTVGMAAARVYATLLGLPGGDVDAGPTEIAGMPYVTPGDPTRSFLMHKLDGDLCTVTGCVDGNAAVEDTEDPPGSLEPGVPPNWCGVSMPFDGDPLDPENRDLLRRWIAQGASEN